MDPTFKLAALGIQPNHDPQVVRAQLQAMMKNDSAAFNDIFHRIMLNQTVVLGENIPKDKARNLLEKLTAIGLKCRLDPMALSLVPIEEEEQQNAVYRCPACGHTQPPARGGNLDICERCGVVGQNYETTSELKQALEMERRRLKSALEKEKREKLSALQDKANKQREKAQQEAFDRARRQVEKELGIGPRHKLKALLKPGVLYPVLGSLSVGLIGVGLLIWQLGGSVEQEPVANPQRAGLQLTVTPPPGATIKIEGLNSQVAPDGAGTPAPGEALAMAGSPATAGVTTATTTTLPQAGNPAGSAATARDAQTPAQTAALLEVDRLALTPPVDGSATGKTANAPARDPQLLIKFARYQLQTGDLPAATRSVDRASDLQAAKRNNLANHQMDEFNRAQAEVRAEIASQHHQRKELVTAQTHWFRATHLTHSITTSAERAMALSGLARTMNEAQASTAEEYFSQSIAALSTITDPFTQALVLGTIARDLAQTGRASQSEVLFEQAAAAVKTIRNPQNQTVARTILAKHHAEAGDTATARILLAQVASEGGDKTPPESNPHRAETLSAIAYRLAHRGEPLLARADFAAALQQIQTLKEPLAWAGTLLYLARDLAAAGDQAAAARLAAAAGPWD